MAKEQGHMSKDFKTILVRRDTYDGLVGCKLWPGETMDSVVIRLAGFYLYKQATGKAKTEGKKK